METNRTLPRALPVIALSLIFIATLSQAQPFIPDANTFGLWHFDEAPGTFVAFDASSQGFNMSLTNGAQFSGSGGYYGGGVDLTDPDARVTSVWTVGNGWTALTVDAYIYATAINNDEHPIVCRTDFWNIDEVSYYFHVRENGSIAGGVWLNEVGTESAEAISAPGAIQTGQWYRVAMTWCSGQPVRIFVDDLTTPLVTGVESPTGYIRISDDPLMMGCNGYQIYGWFYWQGYLDEVRISNVDRYPLSSYPGEFVVDDRTAALWHFNENSGLVAHDATSNNYDMSLQDGAGWHAPGWNNTPSAVDLTDPDAKVNSNYTVGNGWDAITLEAWIYPTQIGPYTGWFCDHPIITRQEFHNVSDCSYFLYLTAKGEIYAGVNLNEPGGPVSQALTDSGLVQVNNWYHVAATWSNGEPLRIFINDMSNPVEISSDPVQPGVIRSGTDALRIGCNWTVEYYNDWEYFQGYIDEARISDVVRYPEIPSGPVNITLAPINPPIVIPETGGSFSFDAVMTNTSNTSQTFDVWCTIEVPGGAQFTSFGPLALNLDPGANISRLRTQAVPAAAPGGEYAYWGFVGDYPWTVTDSNHFPFIKQSGDGIWTSPDGWVCSGEPFPGEIGERGSMATPTMEVSPNPFNPTTVLSFELRVPSFVKLEVFDIKGQRVEVEFISTRYPAGTHQIPFDGSDLPSGIYLARLIAGDFQQTQKLILLK
jgi:hypothetical protein